MTRRKTRRLGRVLTTVTSELNEAEIDYFLDFGTLLGAYREDRIIPGDYDIDIGCFRRDRARVRRLLRSPKIRKRFFIRHCSDYAQLSRRGRGPVARLDIYFYESGR